jgi:hypothetical protein
MKCYDINSDCECVEVVEVGGCADDDDDDDGDGDGGGDGLDLDECFLLEENAFFLFLVHDFFLSILVDTYCEMTRLFCHSFVAPFLLRLAFQPFLIVVPLCVHSTHSTRDSNVNQNQNQNQNENKKTQR